MKIAWLLTHYQEVQQMIVVCLFVYMSVGPCLFLFVSLYVCRSVFVVGCSLYLYHRLLIKLLDNPKASPFHLYLFALASYR